MLLNVYFQIKKKSSFDLCIILTLLVCDTLYCFLRCKNKLLRITSTTKVMVQIRIIFPCRLQFCTFDGSNRLLVALSADKTEYSVT